MNVTNRHILLTCLKVFDLVLLTVSYGLATILAFRGSHGVSFAQFMSMRIKLSNCLIFAAALLAWHVIFALCGFYKSKRLTTRKEQMLAEWKATTLATICLLLVAVSFSIRMVTPLFLVFFWAISSSGIVLGRFLLRSFLGQVRIKGRNLRHVLILGTNRRALEFARRIEVTPEWGYRNLGFVDTDWAGTKEFQKSGVRVVCDRAGLPDFLRRNVVDEVAIYLPLRSFYEEASQIAALCEQHGIIVRFDSDIFGLRAERAWTEEMDRPHAVATRNGMQEGWPMAAKRALDVIGSLALLGLLLPLFAAVAILIKITSNGPVFFLQERVGLNKRRFLIYKFRTMVPEAEKMIGALEKLNEASGPVFKIKKDPRVTAIGKWLRRASIDELPQLVSVLRGDMSLVGPRPLPVRDYEGFDEDWQRRRFSTRPGITCLWQVQGRSAIGFDQWMKLDMQYLDEWSLWLDLKILARTIPAVLKGSGAT
ncbi:MAG TPA: sugar transferase [Candidatus Acidoferrum sp.]|nr:sugar transferase [Candidatus Acidoferrum sp.]